MYENKKNLYFVFAISLVVVITAFEFIRFQTFVGNREFLQSMIPHHSAAILVCENANISDPEIEKTLRRNY